MEFKAKFGDFASLAIQSVISAFESCEENNNWDEHAKLFYQDRRILKVDLKEMDEYPDEMYEKPFHTNLAPFIASASCTNKAFDIRMRFSSCRNTEFYSVFSKAHGKTEKDSFIKWSPIAFRWKYERGHEGNGNRRNGESIALVVIVIHCSKNPFKLWEIC